MTIMTIMTITTIMCASNCLIGLGEKSACHGTSWYQSQQSGEPCEPALTLPGAGKFSQASYPKKRGWPTSLHFRKVKLEMENGNFKPLGYRNPNKTQTAKTPWRGNSQRSCPILQTKPKPAEFEASFNWSPWIVSKTCRKNPFTRHPSAPPFWDDSDRSQLRGNTGPLLQPLRRSGRHDRSLPEFVHLDQCQLIPGRWRVCFFFLGLWNLWTMKK